MGRIYIHRKDIKKSGCRQLRHSDFFVGNRKFMPVSNGIFKFQLPISAGESTHPTERLF